MKENKEKEVVPTDEEEVLEDFEEENDTTEENSVEESDSETEEPQVTQEITLDDLDDIPDAEKFRKIRHKEKVEHKVLTIAAVKLGKPLTKDQEGKFIPPEENSQGGKYYKAKMIIEIEEEINGDKIREFIPSIFYGCDEEGIPRLIPTIPKACPDDKLDDNFTSSVSKIRNMYCKFKNIDPKQLSSAAFTKGLVGMKFIPKVESGMHKKRPWSKIVISEFVN